MGAEAAVALWLCCSRAGLMYCRRELQRHVLPHGCARVHKLHAAARPCRLRWTLLRSRGSRHTADVPAAVRCIGSHKRVRIDAKVCSFTATLEPPIAVADWRRCVRVYSLSRRQQRLLRLLRHGRQLFIRCATRALGNLSRHDSFAPGQLGDCSVSLTPRANEIVQAVSLLRLASAHPRLCGGMLRGYERCLSLGLCSNGLHTRHSAPRLRRNMRPDERLQSLRLRSQRARGRVRSRWACCCGAR